MYVLGLGQRKPNEPGERGFGLKTRFLRRRFDHVGVVGTRRRSRRVSGSVQLVHLNLQITFAAHVLHQPFDSFRYSSLVHVVHPLTVLQFKQIFYIYLISTSCRPFVSHLVQFSSENEHRPFTVSYQFFQVLVTQFLSGTAFPGTLSTAF